MEKKGIRIERPTGQGPQAASVDSPERLSFFYLLLLFFSYGMSILTLCWVLIGSL